MELTSNRYDTPVPIEPVKEETVPLQELITALNGPGDRVVQVAIRGQTKNREVCLGRLPSTPMTRFALCIPHEIRIRGYYAIGRTMFVTGNAQLHQLLDEPTTLDILVDAIRRRKDPQTGVAPSQARFVGQLETTLMRRDGRWTDITPRGHGPGIVGVDAQDGVAFAIRLRGEDKPIEIVRGKPVDTGIINWESITIGTEGKRIVDASRFLRDRDGHHLALVRLECGQVRLLTIERRGKTFWSEPNNFPGAPIEVDGKSSVLAQTWVADGFLVTRYPTTFFNLPLWAYLRASD